MKRPTLSPLWLLCGSCLFFVGCANQIPELPPESKEGSSALIKSSPSGVATPPSAMAAPKKTYKKCIPPGGIPPKKQPSREHHPSGKPDDNAPGGSGGFWWRSPKTWQKMNKVERRDHMTRDVHPRLWTMFRRFDKKFDNLANFHCGTCHGQTDKVKNPDFSKPTTLFPLNPKNMPTRYDCDPKTAAMVRFMEDKVVPAMKQFVQNPKIDCFSCHAKTDEGEKETSPKNHP